MQTENINKPYLSKANTFIIFALVFFSGFANLATEIIGPRLFASIFGYTTTIWAIIIAITLLGISVGYYIGGRISAEKVTKLLPLILLANAFWLLAISWIIWELPAQLTNLGILVVLLTAFIAFFIPATLFSMTSPFAITLFSINQHSSQISRTVGNIYALSTVGSVLGALLAAYFFIPWVGLSLSLRIFAIMLVLFAIYFFSKRTRFIAAIGLLLTLLIPQPTFQWNTDMQLLTQQEGYYQTIRVYLDDPFLRFYLGPTNQSEIDVHTREPKFDYSRIIFENIKEVQGRKSLIIGGAGHAIAHTLEQRGATVTEVEIDEVVVKVSDEFFDKIKGDVVVQDGRAFVEQSPSSTYDYVFIDAFNALSIPPQLTSLEFFSSIQRILKPDGRLIVNFIGLANGEHAQGYRAMSATISKVFSDTRILFVYGEKVQEVQNILFFASSQPIQDLQLAHAPVDGFILTDDLNPIEIFFEESFRGELVYQR